MEILRVNAPSEFTYTIGIECASGADDIIKAAIEVLESVPTRSLADFDFSCHKTILHP
jgi:hypothetical protein